MQEALLCHEGIWLWLLRLLYIFSIHVGKHPQGDCQPSIVSLYVEDVAAAEAIRYQIAHSDAPM